MGCALFGAHSYGSLLCQEAVGSELLTLAQDRSRRVRGQLAGFRTNLPADVRALLARDTSADVRWELTMSRQPESIADVLRNDPHPDVVANVEQWQPEEEA